MTLTDKGELRRSLVEVREKIETIDYDMTDPQADLINTIYIYILESLLAFDESPHM